MKLSEVVDDKQINASENNDHNFIHNKVLSTLFLAVK